MAERISLRDETFYGGYVNHIQRYEFAEPYCRGRRVLDAGCGIGYGSSYLALNGAANVVGVDIAEEALAEAGRTFRRDNLRFIKGDVEKLNEIPDLGGPFDVVVNLENIEHIKNPTAFLEGAKRAMTGEGTLVVSTPNGDLTERDAQGNIKNPFHVKEFTEAEFRELLGPVFGSLSLFGQWKTPERIARIDFEERLFKTICELYYSPGARLWRKVRRLLGKTNTPPPRYTGAGTCYSREFVIKPLDSPPFPWPPDVILAVCHP